jgi:hypothetical protein
MNQGTSRTPILKWIKVGLVTMTIAFTAYGHASGPPSSRTGAPGEPNCTQCHTGTLNAGAGSVSILGVPDVYVPGEQYTLTVRVAHPDRRRWGFQITALDSANRGAGTLARVNPNLTRLVNGSGQFAGRVYIEQTSTGTFEGQSQNAEWEVNWTAPATDIGRITFYAAGNAANNNDSSNGDNIYTTFVRSGTVLPTIIAPAFKKGKIVMSADGSNIENGATLDVTNGSTTETFALALNGKGTKWVVKKSAASTPGGVGPEAAWPAGTTVTMVVRNSDGQVSPAVEVSR